MNIQQSSPSGQLSFPPLSLSSMSIPFTNPPLVFLSCFASHHTHLFVLIWKIELEMLAMFCSELCGVQLNKKSRGGRREIPRGCRGLSCLECLYTVDQIKVLFKGKKPHCRHIMHAD
ncbi:Hypothetical predicted protein [Xyrichtys novacula]|uniref:Uncharacterized protein n=1 Tax=Xyrichtys novacula TaxID=13765 RepID=A0AAV1G242_XYRNO|nr:Hypothetical predicted protein [Xyrichtys novacula]